MDPSDAASNHSQETEPHGFKTFLSNEDRQIFVIVNYVIITSLVGLFGIVTNVINLVVFYKQGLDTSINITFFALAISDLAALLMQEMFNVFVNPLFERLYLLIEPSEFKYLTAGVPRVAFTRITCLTTVYITMERCLCIIFPLHVKQMITPRRTALFMCAIHIVTYLSFAPLYCNASIGWKFYPDRNRTLLGLIFVPNSDELTQNSYIFLAFMGLAIFAGVVIFTAILIRKLAEKSNWRKSANADQAKSETISKRDQKTVRMVVLIASILIICNTPSIVMMLVTFVEPEFNLVGKYRNLYVSVWSFAFVFETINYSVNIFLYHKMSTKYRETFRGIFARKYKHNLSSKDSQGMRPNSQVNVGQLEIKL